MLGLRCCMDFLWFWQVGITLVVVHRLRSTCLGARAPRHSGLQQLLFLGSRAQLWHAGLVALQHVGSSQTKDQTHAVSPAVGVGFFTSEPWGKPGVGFFVFFFLISIYFLPDLYYFPSTDLRFCFFVFSYSFRSYVRLLIWDFFFLFSEVGV